MPCWGAPTELEQGQPRANFTSLSSRGVKKGSHCPGNERCGVETAIDLSSPRLGIEDLRSSLLTLIPILNISSNCRPVLKAQVFDRQNGCRRLDSFCLDPFSSALFLISRWRELIDVLTGV
jgi:hypothetical protein